ncbi:MAG: protein-tyrosine phosphatase family protein [Armatimonadota bacterium]|nr:protein-tyrosine phosphatase family protein [Armatimonadota bacterium]MDR7444701.1 protein-tyrosine phosphatase family protein [Armatimonadota bacterium]MDR7571232.1 protein-tyrosine phosphatase family protein [Armatimonadota bacterium]MDR7613295.1 protein-tyrosine phosphatase family protein [Armatimonadota bacterium]
MFREVRLPEGTKGRLYLHSMPGRCEPFEEAVAEARRLGITTVVRLTPLHEVAANSPQYAWLLRSGRLPWREEALEVPDHGVPEDREGFLRLVTHVADRLKRGERVLVHCAAGVGRTGMFATCVLLALGLDVEQATQRVKQAGSCPERGQQEALVRWAGQRLRARRP